MEWTPGGTSEDIEDRRDSSGGGGGGGFGGFGGGGGFGGIHLGIGGTIVLLVLSYFFHSNLFSIFTGGGVPASNIEQGQPPSAPDRAKDAAEQPEVQFVSFVLDDVQHTWDQLLPQQTGVRYHHAHLVLFRDSIDSGCGAARAATGPFYCPEDEKVYIDLGFYDELKSRFGAPGEFAQAYVLAHEIGHHVQKLLGIQRRAQDLEQRDRGSANAVSVQLELQADCFAGVWGNTTEQRHFVHEQDVQQGLAAAAAVGDDRLQRMATGHVSPETFTHGSSAQRMAAFRRGLDSGQVSACTGGAR